MKTERRHELQTNILADTLGTWVEKIKPHLKTIAIVALFLVVAGAAYGIISWGSRRKNAAAWQLYMTAARNSDVETYEDVVTTYGKSKPGLWARLSMANIQLTDAATEISKDPENAEKEFKKVILDYTEVSEAAGSDSMIYGRAQYGLAVAHEYLAAVTPRKYIKEQHGHIVKAIAIYDELAKSGSETIAEASKNNRSLLGKYASIDTALENELKDVPEAEREGVREAFSADNRTDAQKVLLKKFPKIERMSSDWDDKTPDFGQYTYLSWLAVQNYKSPLGGFGGGRGLGGPGGPGGGLGGPGGGLGGPGGGLGGPGGGLGGPGGGLGGGDEKSGMSPGERLLKDIGKGINLDTKKDESSSKKTPANKDDQFPLDKKKAAKTPAKSSKGKDDKFPIEKDKFPLKDDKKGKTPSAAKGGLNPPANTPKGKAEASKGAAKATVKKAVEAPAKK